MQGKAMHSDEKPAVTYRAPRSRSCAHAGCPSFIKYERLAPSAHRDGSLFDPSVSCRCLSFSACLSLPIYSVVPHAMAARAWGRAPGGADEYLGKRDRRRQRAGWAESRQAASNGTARATQQRINRRLTSQAPLAGSWQASDKHVRGIVVCELGAGRRACPSSHLISSAQWAAGSGQ
jgi:hypothetical protein